jgi:ketosteroid isomerase-like protein
MILRQTSPSGHRHSNRGFPMNIRSLLTALALAIPLAASAGTAAATEPVARAGLQAYLSLWAGEPAADGTTPFSPDLVLRYAHSLPELRGELRGRASAVRQTRALASLGRDWTFRDVRLFPTLQPDVYYAQYTASGRSAADGTPVERHVVLRLEMEKQQLVRLVEFANPAVALAAGAR